LRMVVRIVTQGLFGVVMRTRVAPLARCIITLNWLGVESAFWSLRDVLRIGGV
jgi:hypothetical protein